MADKDDNPNDPSAILPFLVPPEVVFAFAEEARRVLQAEVKRHEDVDGKHKVLLTAVGVVMAVNGVLIANLSMPLLGLLPICFLLGAVFLLLRHLRTGSYTVVGLDEVEWRNLVVLRRQMAVKELGCALDWSLRIDFLVGIQRAAYRALLIAVFVDVVLLGFAIHDGTQLGAALTGEPVTSSDFEAVDQPSESLDFSDARDIENPGNQADSAGAGTAFSIDPLGAIGPRVGADSSSAVRAISVPLAKSANPDSI
ncbi:MAG: hypothetical protein IH621_09035 [Krumholzibacteria bacterium]|nr:hypothetical protein [Candidatus Krumholzibacteria bacterium]